ncbi:AI-2E family transporter [Flindersiella endophytica]
MPEAGSSPAVLPRGVVVLLWTASLVVAVAGIRAISGLIGPIFLALMLVIAVTPVQEALRKRGLPGWLGTVVTLILLYAVLLGLGVVLAVSVARLAALVPQYSTEAQGLVDSVENLLSRLGVSTTEAGKLGAQIDYNRVFDLMTGVLSGLAGVFSNLLFLVLLMFFMTLDAAGFPARMAEFARVRPDVATALGSFVHGTRRYLAVSTVFGAIVAVLDSVALAIMSVPLPLLWGVLAFITNYIPNIGFVIGVIPPALLGLLDGGWPTMVLVIVVYSVINFVLQTVVQPKFMSDSLGLTVTITFLGLTFWAWALGALGALLAIPLTLLAKALMVDIDPASRWANLFLEARPIRQPDKEPVKPSATQPPPETEVERDED